MEISINLSISAFFGAFDIVPGGLILQDEGNILGTGSSEFLRRFIRFTTLKTSYIFSDEFSSSDISICLA